MGLLDRFSRLIRANVSYVVSGAEDPEKALQQAVTDMQSDLVSMRQAVAQAIATQKRTERQCQQANRNAQDWYDRAQVSLQTRDEDAARAALTRRQGYIQTAQSLQTQIAHHAEIVQKLKATMVALEAKLADARMKKDMYIARARAARSSAQLSGRLNQNSHSSESVLERMEARVLDLEAQAEIARDIGTDALERQFDCLERQAAVEAQLTQLKRQLKSRPSK